jgi:L-lactate dehydrogenase complex protein LldG
MMAESAKEAILARIRAALAGAPEAPAIPRAYRMSDDRDPHMLVAELIDRLRDYKATVERIEGTERLPAAIAAACARYGIHRLVVPNDMPAEWIPEGIEALRDDPPLANDALDASDGVLTGCAFAVAQTGTIVLDGGARQGRRALSLVPDRHLCVVRVDQVVGIVPEVIARLSDQPSRPITFISGPSATSDIELSRVEGVHGPRTLHVLLVGGSADLSATS